MSQPRRMPSGPFFHHRPAARNTSTAVPPSRRRSPAGGPAPAWPRRSAPAVRRGSAKCQYACSYGFSPPCKKDFDANRRLILDVRSVCVKVWFCISMRIKLDGTPGRCLPLWRQIPLAAPTYIGGGTCGAAFFGISRPAGRDQRLCLWTPTTLKRWTKLYFASAHCRSGRRLALVPSVPVSSFRPSPAAGEPHDIQDRGAISASRPGGAWRPHHQDEGTRWCVAVMESRRASASPRRCVVRSDHGDAAIARVASTTGPRRLPPSPPPLTAASYTPVWPTHVAVGQVEDDDIVLPELIRSTHLSVTSTALISGMERRRCHLGEGTSTRSLAGETQPRTP